MASYAQTKERLIAEGKWNFMDDRPMAFTKLAEDDQVAIMSKDAPKLSDPSGLKSLGSKKTDYVYTGADKKLLERFPNPMPKFEADQLRNGHQNHSSVEITAPEFTSLCPLTGQPDFAAIVVRYTPRDYCVESKSFKLYLGSFRNVGEFHEACTARIFADLWELLNPMALCVQGQFTPRGGIKFWPTVFKEADDV